MGLIFDGVDLEERWGFMVDGVKTWDVPKRDQEAVHIPGRNGDLIIDKGCWKNVDITYHFLIKDRWIEKFDDFCAWISQRNGYYQLEDPERHPGIYRMAAILDDIKPTLWFRHKTGIFDITFSCKPQKYLFEGEEPQIQLLLQCGAATSLVSGSVEKSGNIVKVTPTIPAEAAVDSNNDPVTITASLILYDDSKTVLETLGPTTLSDGVAVDFTIEDDDCVYWQLTISGFDYTKMDLIYARVQSEILLGGEKRQLNAIFAKTTPKFQNPTGYEAKPIIRHWGSWGYSVTLKNYAANGALDSFISWSLDTTTLTDVSIMDCDMQYVYYNYTDSDGFKRKGSLGSIFTITDTGSQNEEVTYPFLGEHSFNFISSGGAYPDGSDPGIIEIIPRWVII